MRVRTWFGVGVCACVVGFGGAAAAKPEPSPTKSQDELLKPITPKVPLDPSVSWQPRPCPQTMTRCRVGADGVAALNQPGFCVPRDDPAFGCGSCRACVLQHADGPRCGAGGTCDYTSCQQGYADRDGVRSNGCEALVDDPWRFLANGVTDSPMCDAYSDRMLCQFRRPDGQLQVSHYYQRYFSWPAPLGLVATSGAIGTSEQTYSSADGHPAFRVVAWRGPNQQLILQDHRGGAAVGTTDAGGILVSRPDCAQAAPVGGDHRVACIVRGTDDRIWIYQRNGAATSPWTALAGDKIVPKTSAGPSIVGAGAHGAFWDIAYLGPRAASGRKPLMVTRYSPGSTPQWKLAGELDVADDSDLNCDSQWLWTAAGSFGLHCVYRSQAGEVREIVVEPTSGTVGSQWNWGHPHGKPAKFTPYLTHIHGAGNKVIVVVAEGFYNYPGETPVPGDSLWIRELPRY